MQDEILKRKLYQQGSGQADCQPFFVIVLALFPDPRQMGTYEHNR